MILANQEAADRFNFNKAIFPGTQGGPLEHVIAAKAVCFGEALKPEFKAYQAQVRKNAAALAEALTAQGFKLLTGGTDNHLMLVDLRGMEVSGKELQNRCDEVYITLNKNMPRIASTFSDLNTALNTAKGLLINRILITKLCHLLPNGICFILKVCGRHPDALCDHRHILLL